MPMKRLLWRRAYGEMPLNNFKQLLSFYDSCHEQKKLALAEDSFSDKNGVLWMYEWCSNTNHPVETREFYM